MEGIMMRNEDRYSVAVRKKDGEIELMTDDFKPVLGGTVTKIPFVRGIFVMINSLSLGLKTLSWSAEFFEDEEEDQKKAEEEKTEEKKNEEKKAEEKGAEEDKTEDKKEDWGKASKDKKESDNSLMMALTLVLSFAMSIVIFVLIPYFISELIRKATGSRLLPAIAEGVLRLIIFIGYVAAISLMEDIKRVYMYHGAEHKCINCVERGCELNVKNVMDSSRFHPRCGTSFMLFVMVISIILFLFIHTDDRIMRLVIRLLLIPVIAGISYEVIRLAGSTDNFLVRALSAPGIWLQHLTTREPDEQMAEVAISAVEAVFDWKTYLSENFPDSVKQTDQT